MFDLIHAKNREYMFRFFIPLIISLFIIPVLSQQYFFYDNEKQTLTRVDEYISVTFVSSSSASTVNDYKESILRGVSQDIWEMNRKSEWGNEQNILLIKFKESITNLQQTAVVQGLLNSSDIEHIGICLKARDKVLHFTTNELIVKFKKGVTSSVRENLSRLFKTKNEVKIESFDDVYMYSIESNGKPGTEDVFDITNRYSFLDFVEFAQPNFIRYGMLLEIDDFKSTKPLWPDDSLLPMMWHIKNTGNNIPNNVHGIPGCDINGDSAWDISTGHPNVLISITDTGVDTNHPDLKPNLCDRNLWYDAYDNDQKPYDEHFHGTGVSGVALAAGNNHIGTIGVAFNCKIMPVRVFGPAPLALTTDLILAKGLNWAWQHGAAVINCSWGGGIPAPLIDHAVENALNYGRNSRGTVICAGAGNDNIDYLIYPASRPGVMGIGGLSPCNERKSLTSCDNIDSLQEWGASYGENLSVVAPTTYIGTTEAFFGGWCICGNGTSVASPIVAGIAGLMISKNINLSGDSVKLIIETTARKVGNYAYNFQKEHGLWDWEMGYGRVDAKYALEMTPSGTTGIFDQVPPIVELQPPESQLFSTSIPVYAIITDNNSIASGYNAPRLYFKTNLSGTTYTVIGSEDLNNRYIFVLPLIGAGIKVHYYIAAQDTSSNGNVTTYPLGGKGINPPGNIMPPKWMFLQNTDFFDTVLVSRDVPIRIAESRETTIVSNLNNPFYRTLLDADCLINIEHTYLADITVSLISPTGSEIILTGGLGWERDNYTNTYFDDEAQYSIDDTNFVPPYTGSFKPLEKLWMLDGENSFGNWKLKVVDNGANDGGKLTGWSVKFRYSKSFDENNIPSRFELINNFPNPFNPRTRILFNVSGRARIRIELYDVLGRKVTTILDETRDAKYYDYVDFDISDARVNSGRGIASGIYFYVMFADNKFIQSRRMAIIK
jgi:subtilisin family serine protease/subtilisin-like proprotein convertase family protein